MIEEAGRGRVHVWPLVAVLAVCALVYWPGLGREGLRSTEGHRAIPGWEALEGGAWMPTRMFGAAYIRKPPGMPWAVAASSAVLGETEFAARLPSALSATLMAATACLFAARWFGARGALAAGLAQALMPRLWSVGRTADIEVLHALGVQVAALVLVDLLVFRAGRPAWAGLLWMLLGAAGLAVAVLAKAHAGLPAVVGVIIGACIVGRSWGPLARPALWGLLAMCAGMIAPLGWLYWRALGGERAVGEDFATYLWDSRRVVETAVFPLAVFATGLPATLALLFVFGPDARREAESDPAAERGWSVARALTWAFFVGVVIYWCAGVSNARYALPLLALVPPCAGYVVAGWREGPGAMLPHRRRIARWMMLGRPAALGAALMCGAVWFLTVGEAREASSSGRAAGLALGAALPDGSAVWADGMINAKPEVLWYARRAAATDGRKVTVRWSHFAMRQLAAPPNGTLMVLNSGERARYESAHGAERFHVLHEGVADTTRFWLVRTQRPGAP